MSQLTIKCTKGNEPKGSLHIKSPDCFKCKNATINLENFDNTCFQYAFTLTPHYKEMKKMLGEHQVLKHLLICIFGII